MRFAPALRRFTFTAHVTSSLGWLGAVIVFISLAAIGLSSEDEATVRGAYLVMAPAAWFALVPLSHASLLSGIALSLGTTWGLVRHYWGKADGFRHVFPPRQSFRTKDAHEKVHHHRRAGCGQDRNHPPAGARRIQRR